MPCEHSAFDDTACARPLAVVTRLRDVGGIAVLLCLVAFCSVVLSELCGQSLFNRNPYNSFTLQTLRWFSGHLDLGQNYPHLELAIYQGRYFVSFPAAPSIVLAPVIALLGERLNEHWVGLFFCLMASLYLYLLARQQQICPERALLLALLATVGSNALHLMVNPGWVWYLAQNMAFAFTVMAFYYAQKNTPGFWCVALLCLVIAAGCRPFQLLYAPVVLMFIWQRQRHHLSGAWWAQSVKIMLPALLFGGALLVLNQLRFGNVLEFGHNHLPEFTGSRHGQFNAAYLADNLKSLLRLPYVDGTTGMWQFHKFNGTALYLVSPIFVVFAVSLIGAAIQKNIRVLKVPMLILGLLVVHTLLLCLHKTMGGFHFGHRYLNDLIPACYLGLVVLHGGKAAAGSILVVPALVVGLFVNALGTLMQYQS
ncbi:hypothetical protein [Sinimarinibacterium sp. NLF-5-8]|uniref:hypothetical protein n=1 Tax=Sinimarinibacterium sp. NLF-5-8 TaxID=2698684 RepID=UPI00137C33D4|nr:hypothetical protein [Sinimarinibacterium sp. NLF-5-8]QHS11196.1 hypothetical protein GT972_14290 [Sinimarinibacterium sp. NLF-5-8]